jgi:hypothetical protein
MKKSTAFLIGLGVICLIMIVNFIKLDFPAGIYLTAVVSLTTGYFALNVANNGVKGKFWNHEMYHHENDKQEG